MKTRGQFRRWMNLNAVRLRQCKDAMEMAELAVCAGASIKLACKMLSQGHVDILTRSSERTRAKYYIDEPIKIIETRNGRPDLDEQWKALANRLLHGDDFTEAI